MSDDVLTGGCACGNCRYRITREPIFVNNCHCRQCQQQSGAASVVNLFVETDHVDLLSGRLEETHFTSGSGGDHRLSRCADCGSPLWSAFSGMGPMAVGIRAGSLDDPARIVPDAIVFAGERMPWVGLPEGIPVFDAYYSPREVLPPERFERLKSVVKRKEAPAANPL